MSSLSCASLFPEMPASRQLLPPLPQGFIYQPEFISEAEERRMLHEIRAIALRTAVWNGYAAKRRIASFALSESVPETYKSDPNKGSATLSDNPQQRDDGTVESKPVHTEAAPSWMLELSERVADFLGYERGSICHALLTEYPPGAPIGWHRDSPPHRSIIGLSLGSDCTFRLRPQYELQRNRSSVISFQAEARSLYEMAGASRSRWQHSISPVRQQRWSITMRTI
ncbi:MAG: alpha-ketoglutarate-dependent dioxygenase AlkB [bacterium]